MRSDHYARQRVLVRNTREPLFQPTCPRCSRLCAADAVRCPECACRLYPASFYPERKR